MNFVFGALTGAAVAVFVMDPAILSGIFHYLGDFVANKEWNNASGK